MPLLVKNSHILIVRLSSFGDVLLTTPLLRSIKLKYPDSTIDFLVKAPFSSMLENNPNIKNIILYDKEKQSHKAKLETKNYNLVVDLQNNQRSHALKAQLKFDNFVAYDKQRVKRFIYMHLGGKAFNNPIRSVQERYADTCAIKIDSAKPDFFVQSKYKHTDFDFNTENYICIAAGAAHHTKQWPVENYIAFAKQMNEYKIVLLGGAAEESTAKKIDSEIACLNLVGKTNFDETASILMRSKALACNDSSIMHLAYALEVKTLVFFGSTTQQFGFAPKSENIQILENNDVPCRPCSHIGKSSCPKNHFNCMRSILPENASVAFQQLLGKQ